MSTAGYIRSQRTGRSYTGVLGSAQEQQYRGTYGGKHHVFSAQGNLPPQWVLDRDAQRVITGGYNTRKSNICGACNMARFANGTCYCA